MNTKRADIIRSVRRALLAAGERECRICSTRTTNRSWYAGGSEGWRSFESTHFPTFKPVPDGLGRLGDAQGTTWLTIGCDGNKRAVLQRYAEILTAAGFPVHVCGTHVHPTALRVWIDQPWTDADEVEES